MNIVLVEPEIPQNTGNIVRTCHATGSALHIVKPMGFEVTDRHLKRAGLDYWKDTEIYYYESFEELKQKYQNAFYYATTKAAKSYTAVSYERDCFIVFGKETKGLDEKLLSDNYENCIRIPMIGETRSLNLANSVAIILYEALRQNNFDGFKFSGRLTKY